MKKCPSCQMIVDAYNECPLCGNDLTGEPQSTAQFEKYRLNKWFFVHLIKKQKFPLVCTAIVLVVMVTSVKVVDYWLMVSVFLTGIMWFESLFKNLSFKIFGNIYNENYLESTHKIGVYGSGVLAAIVAMVSIFL